MVARATQRIVRRGEASGGKEDTNHHREHPNDASKRQMKRATTGKQTGDQLKEDGFGKKGE